MLMAEREGRKKVQPQYMMGWWWVFIICRVVLTWKDTGASFEEKITYF